MGKLLYRVNNVAVIIPERVCSYWVEIIAGVYNL